MISISSVHLTNVVLIVTVMGVTTAGCGSRDPYTQEAQPEQESLDSLRSRILELIGEPVVSDISQCRLIAFGAKPCGGPRAYLVYSMEATDSTELARAVAMYTSEDARLNQELGRASDCRLVMPPQITFAAGRCATAR